MAKGGIAENRLVSIVSYVLLIVPFGWVASFVIYALSKDSFTRFHALQATLLGVASQLLILLLVLSILLALLVPLVGLLALIALLVGSFKAYNGERYELPVIGEMASRHS